MYRVRCEWVTAAECQGSIYPLTAESGGLYPEYLVSLCNANKVWGSALTIRYPGISADRSRHEANGRVAAVGRAHCGEEQIGLRTFIGRSRDGIPSSEPSSAARKNLGSRCVTNAFGLDGSK